MTQNNSKEYRIIVIGAGHAGCEAGLVCARLGMETAMFCTDIDSVAMMPCNPSIGGTGKGHLVREVDALGGEMGLNIDKTFIQSKMLNTSKGPAVHSLRAQADKEKYHQEMLKTIREQGNLDLIEDEITELLLSDSSDSKGSGETVDKYIRGVRTSSGMEYSCDEVIICTGTFLAGKIFNYIGACDSFYTSYTGSNTCFADDLEASYFTGVVYMSASAELDAVIAHADNSYNISVLFSENSHGSELLGFVDRHFFHFDWKILIYLLVDDCLYLADLFSSHRLEVVEVESEVIVIYV